MTGSASSREVARLRKRQKRALRQKDTERIIVVKRRWIAALGLLALGLGGLLLCDQRFYRYTFSGSKSGGETQRALVRDMARSIQMVDVRSSIDHSLYQSGARHDFAAIMPNPPPLREVLNGSVYYDQAVLSLKSGDSVEAIGWYLRSLHANPFSAKSWASLGREYLAMNDFPKAERALACAAMLHPQDGAVVNDWGVALYQVGLVKKALEAFFVAQIGGCRLALFNESLTLLALEKKDAAYASIEEFCDSFPDDTEALVVNAYLLVAQKRYDAAAEVLDQALNSDAKPSAALQVNAAAAEALSLHIDNAVALLKNAEELTSASAILDVLEQPAFEGLSLTQQGKQYRAHLGAVNDSEEQDAKQESSIDFSVYLRATANENVQPEKITQAHVQKVSEGE